MSPIRISSATNNSEAVTLLLKQKRKDNCTKTFILYYSYNPACKEKHFQFIAENEQKTFFSSQVKQEFAKLK